MGYEMGIAAWGFVIGIVVLLISLFVFDQDSDWWSTGVYGGAALIVVSGIFGYFNQPEKQSASGDVGGYRGMTGEMVGGPSMYQ